MTKLKTFQIDGKIRTVTFVETLSVAEGVSCDVYSIVEDESKDLGVIYIKKGRTTPLQKVLRGKKTVEGYVRGRGTLQVSDGNGVEEYTFKNEYDCTEVKIGQIMQWRAQTDLVVYEICNPPYSDGRFQNIDV